jgi:hypothetical protein
LNLSLLRLLQKNRRKNREAGQEDSSLNVDEGGLGRSYALGFNGKGVCRQIRRAVEEAVIRGLKVKLFINVKIEFDKIKVVVAYIK